MVNTMFILDRALNTSHILTANRNSQNAFWEDTYTQEFDTGAESLEFSCYTHENIREGNHVAFFYNNQYKLFQIVEIEEVHEEGRLVSRCYCETASLQLLNNYVRPFSGDMNCLQFFQHILADTEWHIGRYSDSLVNNVVTVNESGVNSVWSLIEDYKDLFECEINVYVTYANGRVTGQFIDIYSEGGLGSSTLKRFEYGRNVTGITKKKDLYDWCTGIIVHCNCEVTDIVITEEDGLGFTKKAGDVILDDSANRMYNAGRTHVLGVYEGDEENPHDACVNAWKELQKRKEPKFDYQVTTAIRDDEYEDMHLGDTVYVIDRSYTPPLFLEARIGKLELSFTNKSNNSCTLTNYKEIKSKLLDADYIKLTGTITDIVNAFFPIGPEGIQDGAIVEGKIETTYFQEITADIVSASVGAFEDLYVGNMTVINADIENLKAETAEIALLKSSLAEIDTMINGHLTSDNIQSMIITGDKFTVEDAFIKDAMIDTINANKIVTGTLDTSTVNLSSDDGSMTIEGSLQQFRDDNDTVRIQLGKDVNGNFTFALFSQDGQGVLIDETGLHAGAVPNGLIVNGMVADNANIAGNKLDINSVITSINNGTTNIDSSKVYIDEEGQSLQVAFNRLKTKVETIEEVTVDGDLTSVLEQVTSNTTNINIIQGQINSLISNTTITKENGEVVQLKDEYNSTKDTVNTHVTKIGLLEDNVDSLNSKQSSIELDLDGFRTEVSSTYVSREEMTDLASLGDNLIQNGRFIGASLQLEDFGLSPWVLEGAFQLNNTDVLYNSAKKNLHLEMYGEGVPGRIYQVLADLNVPPKNEYVTLSFFCNWQKDITPLIYRVQFLRNDTLVSETTGNCEKNKDNAVTLTTPGTNFNKVIVSFESDGLVIGGSTDYNNVFLNKAKLELGTVATGWVENSHFAETVYATKTELQQTNNEFIFKISQAGGANIVHDSLFRNVAKNWIPEGGSSRNPQVSALPPRSAYNNHKDNCLQFKATASSPGQRFLAGFRSVPMAVKGNTTYTLSAYVCGQRCLGVDLAVIGESSDSGSISLARHSLDDVGTGFTGSTSYFDWTRVSDITFTTRETTTEIFLRVETDGHNGDENDLSLLIGLALPCIVEGTSSPATWVGNKDEVMDGITTIDHNGIRVEHTNSNTVTTMQANGFRVTHTDGSYSMMTGDGFERYIASNGHKYKCLYTSGYIVLDGGKQYELFSIELPAEFDTVGSSLDLKIIFTMVRPIWNSLIRACMYDFEIPLNTVGGHAWYKNSKGHWQCDTFAAHSRILNLDDMTTAYVKCALNYIVMA